MKTITNNLIHPKLVFFVCTTLRNLSMLPYTRHGIISNIKGSSASSSKEEKLAAFEKSSYGSLGKPKCGHTSCLKLFSLLVKGFRPPISFKSLILMRFWSFGILKGFWGRGYNLRTNK
jgi:hypothetical protein